MIPCKHCNTLNGLDSTFCKRCGTGLPEDEIEAGKLKLEAIVQEGVTALNEGRVAEALAIADTAAAADPSMASAVSLKATAHERRGEIAEALESAERLVELNPDSELDKIKRNQLRTALAANAMASRPPSKAVAFVAATSAVLFIVCCSVMGARILDRKQGESKVVATNPVVQPNLGNPTLDPNTTNPQTGSPIPTNPQTGQGATVPPVAPPVTQNNVTKAQPADNSDEGGSDPVAPPSSGGAGTLPSASGLQIGPITPNVPSGLTTHTQGTTPPPSAPTQNNVKANGGDPQPGVENSTTPLPTGPAVTDPGEISIKVHRDGPAAPSGNDDNVKGTSKMYMKMGNDYYQTGNYNGAANTLEKALASGADPVAANHRLAQSYNSLGKKSEAIAAYKRTIDACSKSLNSGKGNSASLRAVRDEAETALRQLQGG